MVLAVGRVCDSHDGAECAPLGDDPRGGRRTHQVHTGKRLNETATHTPHSINWFSIIKLKIRPENRDALLRERALAKPN